MIKIDLITGFLGAGKTTFIKRYASYLLEKGLRVGILENDYGAVNVDMMLLQGLEGDNCGLEMIAGCCCKDTHKRRFKTKLIAMGMSGYDRVIVEPSGIFDVDEFLDTLYEEPLDRWYEIGNIIAVLDARLEEKMSERSEYILASEAADAGCVFLSKCDVASKAEIEATISHLNRALKTVSCKRVFDKSEVLQKTWAEMTDEDFEQILTSGYVAQDYEKKYFGAEEGFAPLYFMNIGLTESKFKKAVEEIQKDASCGKVFRMKGFLQDEAGSWRELNATANEITVKPIEKGQDVLLVIGENLSEQKIESYLR